MLNHLRTLLLNRSGAAVVPDWTIGEQLVPVVYRPYAATSYLQQIFAVLFGVRPDRSFQNYRLAQLMAVLHASEELAEFVYAKDPRVTYTNPLSLAPLYVAATFAPQLISPTGFPAAIQGKPNTPDFLGQCYNQFIVTAVGDSQAQVQQIYPVPSQMWFCNYQTPAGGLSSPIRLGDSGYSLVIPTDVYVGAIWLISFNVRPQLDLGSLLANVLTLPGTTFSPVFGDSPIEPYKTFANLFADSSAGLPYQLGGLLLGLGYRADVLWGGAAANALAATGSIPPPPPMVEHVEFDSAFSSAFG